MFDANNYEPFYFLGKSIDEYVTFIEDNSRTFAYIILEKLDAARTIREQETSDMALLGFYIHTIRRALRYVGKKYKYKGVWSVYGLNIIYLTQQIDKFVHKWNIPSKTAVQWRKLYT
jgi:hypothetical protein